MPRTGTAVVGFGRALEGGGTGLLLRKATDWLAFGQQPAGFSTLLVIGSAPAGGPPLAEVGI